MSSLAHRKLTLSALAGATRLRRAFALLACMGVLGWSLLSATHWHDHADNDPRQHSVAECVLCLGSAAGAAPPEDFVLRLLPPPRSTPVADAAVPAPFAAPPSSYQSRAPPAA